MRARWTVLLVTVSTAGFIMGMSEPHQGTAPYKIANEATFASTLSCCQLPVLR
jgi:hypothetical protein